MKEPFVHCLCAAMSTVQSHVMTNHGVTVMRCHSLVALLVKRASLPHGRKRRKYTRNLRVCGRGCVGRGGNDGDKDLVHVFVGHLLNIDEVGSIFIL